MKFSIAVCYVLTTYINFQHVQSSWILFMIQTLLKCFQLLKILWQGLNRFHISYHSLFSLGVGMAQHWKLGLPWQGQLARGAPVSPWEMRGSRKWQARIGWSHHLDWSHIFWFEIEYCILKYTLIFEIGWHLNLQSPSLQCSWRFVMHIAQWRFGRFHDQGAMAWALHSWSFAGRRSGVSCQWRPHAPRIMPLLGAKIFGV